MHLESDLKPIRLNQTHALACLELDAIALHGLWSADHWERELSDPKRLCLGIGDQAGRLLAMASGWIVLDELQITVIAVRPEQRRNGLGRIILKELLALATQAGANRAVLDVAVSNIAARALYAGLGFQTVGHRNRYYRDGNDALIQSLDMQRKSK